MLSTLCPPFTLFPCEVGGQAAGGCYSQNGGTNLRTVAGVIILVLLGGNVLAG